MYKIIYCKETSSAIFEIILRPTAILNCKSRYHKNGSRNHPPAKVDLTERPTIRNYTSRIKYNMLHICCMNKIDRNHMTLMDNVINKNYFIVKIGLNG